MNTSAPSLASSSVRTDACLSLPLLGGVWGMAACCALLGFGQALQSSPQIALTTEEGAAAARAAWRLIDAVLERIDHARDDPPAAAFHLLDTPAGQIAVTADGCWFEYADEDDAENMHPVVQPDEAIYAYSHGGVRYRAAIEAIATWKESSGWGVTD